MQNDEKNEDIFKLSYPWYTYPNSFCSPYYELELYKSETIRLHNFLKNYNINHNKKTLFHLTIGAAMEELIHEKRDKMNKYTTKLLQWRQLFPVHIENFIFEESEKRKVNIVVVSPNKGFEKDDYKPSFIDKTNDDFLWKRTGKLQYVSNVYNITINIFCTLFPHNDPKNKMIIKKIKRAPINIKPQLLKYIQTKEDRIFVKEFYETLNSVFDNISSNVDNINNGFVTCFSFAVFNTQTAFSGICEYEMFSEIIKSFEDDENRLLAEWTYHPIVHYVAAYGYDVEIKYAELCFGNRSEILFNKRPSLKMDVMKAMF